MRPVAQRFRASDSLRTKRKGVGSIPTGSPDVDTGGEPTEGLPLL